MRAGVPAARAMYSPLRGLRMSLSFTQSTDATTGMSTGDEVVMRISSTVPLRVNSAGEPSAASRPLLTIAARSHNCSASSIACVVSRTVAFRRGHTRARGADAAHPRADELWCGWRHAVRRCRAASADLRGHRSMRRIAGATPAVAGQVEPTFLEHDANARPQSGTVTRRIKAEHPHGPRIGPPIALEYLDGCGLSRTVGPEEAEHFTLRDVECQAVYRMRRSVVLFEASDRDGRIGSCGRHGRASLRID
jgi:hypothetical protein